jgi:hypothetical protein
MIFSISCNLPDSYKAEIISNLSGSPAEPASLHLSRTQTRLTVFGTLEMKYLIENGRYNLTKTAPVLRPFLLR